MTATTSLLTAEIDPNTVKPGWVALLIVLALGAATVLLWRNMGKQLKRIDVDRAGADGPAPSGDPASPDSSPSQDGDAAPTTSALTPTETPTETSPATDAASGDSKESKEHSQH
ncbi:hypothetical protein EV645_1100 [Kribbella rubisoli]|uniref:Uncharacterized protein n=1 Tax=Kribbella rubisoli TaxID=3075929 RepID=A0A4Q7X736_9ACTN|nr:hypothetical protein [Kribbella rubisoli]RZU18900.1 hypothetical protein EV645_1100 [Kribbella rubisoli]